MPARRRGRPWRRLRAHILATRPNICAVCGTTIDLTLPGTHPDGPHGGHIEAVALGGHELDPTNVTPMHNHCNLELGTDHPGPKASRPW